MFVGLSKANHFTDRYYYLRILAIRTHRRRKGSVVGGHHGECGARAYNGQSPQLGPGAEPLVRGLGVRSPPEAESILVIGCPTKPANLAPFQKCICISTLGATVMIWEKLCRNPGRSGDPPCPFLGAPMPIMAALTTEVTL